MMHENSCGWRKTITDNAQEFMLVMWEHTELAAFPNIRPKPAREGGVCCPGRARHYNQYAPVSKNHFPIGWAASAAWVRDAMNEKHE